MTSFVNSTGNFTNSSENLAKIWQSERMKTAEWIVAECVSFITTIFAIYLVAALTHFELAKRGIIRAAHFDSDYTTTGEYETSKDESPDKTNSTTKAKSNLKKFKIRRKANPSHEEKYETWLRALNLGAATFAMLKCLSVHLDLALGTRADEICMAYAFTTVMLNGSSYILVYLLLWLRQWAVHSHPALQHLPVKVLRRLSWILLGAMLVTFASLCVLFFLTIKVEHSSRGCVFADEGTISQGTRSGSGIIFTAFFQPALLALLCYPLLKHTLNRREAFGLKSDGVNIRKPVDDGEAKIYYIIRRLIVSVVVCTISDIGGVIGAFLLEDYPVYYIGLVYDVNITIGAYVITWSFNNWRKRMLPLCSKHKQKTKHEADRTSSPV